MEAVANNENLLRTAKTLDLLLADLNGVVRGKRLQGDAVQGAQSKGIFLPQSVFASDIGGATIEGSPLGIASGDKDYPCRLELDTVRPVPWAGADAAQCMLNMELQPGTTHPACPRDVLRKTVAKLQADGWYPHVAVELEFYLFRNALSDTGQPQSLMDPVSGQPRGNTQVYSMDDLDEFSGFIELVQTYAAQQLVPATTAVAEYAPGQFEINLAHCDDPLRACDDALLLKRIIRQAAAREQMLATFMAKPLAHQPGSGMHIHVSLCDKQGNNKMAADDRSLRAAVAGLQATMNDSMLIFAPHANSYRRFRKGNYVPLSPSWGYNNRSVALRVPTGPDAARRIEHRLAGADANPYLAMAAVLAGIHTGLSRKLQPDEPVEGDATENLAPSLSDDWSKSMETFAFSPWVEDSFGTEFQSTFASIKQAERADHQATIPALDIEWYLRTV